MLPLTTHFTELGEPLISAAEAAEICGVKVGTIYVWVNRKRLAPAGLDPDGLYLFNATDVVKLMPAA